MEAKKEQFSKKGPTKSQLKEYDEMRARIAAKMSAAEAAGDLAHRALVREYHEQLEKEKVKQAHLRERKAQVPNGLLATASESLHRAVDRITIDGIVPGKVLAATDWILDRPCWGVTMASGLRVPRGDAHCQRCHGRIFMSSIRGMRHGQRANGWVGAVQCETLHVLDCLELSQDNCFWCSDSRHCLATRRGGETLRIRVRKFKTAFFEH